MSRIKLVLATLVVLVAAFAAFSVPAMAQEDLNCRDARGELIRCDGELYAPYNADSNDYNDYPPFYYDDYNDDYDYPPPFYDDYNDDYDYPPFYSPNLFDYGYDEGVYEDVLEAQQEYLEELADIYEDSGLEGYSYW